MNIPIGGCTEESWKLHLVVIGKRGRKAERKKKREE